MLAIRTRAHARESAAAIPVISLTFLTTWGQSGASGCRTINHWQLGARKPYGVRLFGVFALVQVGFKFPFGERRIGEFGGKDLLAWPQRGGRRPCPGVAPPPCRLAAPSRMRRRRRTPR